MSIPVALIFIANEYTDPGVTSPPTPATWWVIKKILSSDCMGYVTVDVATKGVPNGWGVTFPTSLESTDHATHPVATVVNPAGGDINYSYLLECWIDIASGGGCGCGCGCGCGGGDTFDHWESQTPFVVLVVDSVKAGPNTRPGTGQMWPRGVK